MTRPTVAVAGATGFVGARVLRRLAETDYQLRASYRPDSPRWHVEDIDCQWELLDLERPATARTFVRGATGVIDCTGYRPRRALRWRRARRRGVGRLRCLFDACIDQNVPRVVYVSDAVTMGAAGAAGAEDQQAVDETCRYVPGSTTNAFVEAKAAMEAEVYRYVADGLDVVVTLPTVVLGPGDVRMKAGRWIRAVVEGRFPAVPEGTTLNVVDVRDVAEGTVAALERGRTGRRYALAGHNVELAQLFEEFARYGEASLPERRIDLDQAQTVAGLVERLIDHLGIDRAPPLLVAAELVDRIGSVSSQRAEGELNFRTRSLGATVRDTVAWMRRVGYLSWSSPPDAPGCR